MLRLKIYELKAYAIFAFTHIRLNNTQHPKKWAKKTGKITRCTQWNKKRREYETKFNSDIIAKVLFEMKWKYPVSTTFHFFLYKTVCRWNVTAEKKIGNAAHTLLRNVNHQMKYIESSAISSEKTTISFNTRMRTTAATASHHKPIEKWHCQSGREAEWRNTTTKTRTPKWKITENCENWKDIMLVLIPSHLSFEVGF